jgi:hypothetical protein
MKHNKGKWRGKKKLNGNKTMKGKKGGMKKKKYE